MLVGNINIRYYIFNKTGTFEIDLDEINPVLFVYPKHG